MKRIITTLAVIGALALPGMAQAETITLNCPSSVVEGGLVAQATNCPSPDLPIGYPYCEYRDEPGQNNSRSTRYGVGPNGRDGVHFSISNADGGVYTWVYTNLFAYSGDTPLAGGQLSLAAGEDRDVTFYVSGRPQYSKGTVGTGEISFHIGGSSGPLLASCDISITDDDNSAYIGQRNQHPYGGTWQTTPHCFTHGCAWQ